MVKVLMIPAAALLCACTVIERRDVVGREVVTTCLQPVASVEMIGVDAVSQAWINETIAANVVACGHPRPEPRSALRRAVVVRPLK